MNEDYDIEIVIAGQNIADDGEDVMNDLPDTDIDYDDALSQAQ